MANLANMTPEAIAAWNRLNESWGQPINVISTYRDPATNARVGGAKRSQHMHGNAFDISTAGMTPEQIDALIKAGAKAGFRGFGGYKNSLHFDVGPARTWGPDYGSGSTPAYLKNALAGVDVAADTMAALGKGGGAVTPDQIAQSAQAQSTGMQEEQQPRGLLGGLFSNPDLMANLAIAFNSMRLNPDPNLPQVLSAQMKQRRDERKSKQELNKTVAMLESIGADPRLIELAKAGYAKEAIAQAYKAPKEAQIIEVDGRLVKYDPKTGATTEVYSSGPDNKAIADARKEFTSQPWVKSFSDQAGAYSRIMKSIEDPSPSGDLALIFNFMKILDPGSVVREGEFATAANAGSVDERVRGLYNRVISGERLTPEQRADFADRATKLYQGASEVYQGRAQQYAGFATAAGLPVEQVIPDFSYGGGLYKKPLEFQVPPTPEGADPNTWPQVWRSMTDAERREYLKEAGML